QRIPLDSGGGMRIADTGVLLQGRNPGHLYRRRGNPLMQGRNLLDFAEKTRGNGVTGPIFHDELVKHKSSYESSPRRADWSSVSQLFSQSGIPRRPDDFSH